VQEEKTYIVPADPEPANCLLKRVVSNLSKRQKIDMLADLLRKAQTGKPGTCYIRKAKQKLLIILILSDSIFSGKVFHLSIDLWDI
jgi:hypothetical protein